MDQQVQDRLQVQGGIDAMKELIDELVQKNMNLRGTIYLLRQQIAELTPKETKTEENAA